MNHPFDPASRDNPPGPADRSGFEDLPDSSPWNRRPCTCPEHNPPGHIVIPQGKRYRHVCPACKQVIYLYPQSVNLSA